MGMSGVTRTAVKAFSRNRMLPRFAPSDIFVWELKHYFLLQLKSNRSPARLRFQQKITWSLKTSSTVWAAWSHIKSSRRPVGRYFTGRCDPTHPRRTQGQIMGVRESLNGGKNGGKKSTRMDQTVPEAQVSGVGELSCLRLHFERFENWVFLKLLIFKRVLYFTFF